MIPFSKPYFSSPELDYIKKALESYRLCGGGAFNKKTQQFLESNFNLQKTLLTPSATAALEMMALLLDIRKGDEIIAPSFTFVSSVNAFALRGARIKFVDIDKNTMNLDSNLLEAAITNNTKAIIPVHYAGISCDMDRILSVAKAKNIAVCEDAAQGVGAFYQNKPLGSLGEFGALSFHETKNITSAGEGGGLIINNQNYIERAEILQEKGTNRQAFFRGVVDKYSWVDIGSSYLMPELNAAFLLGQLEQLEAINKKRLESWNFYYDSLNPLASVEKIELPFVPAYAKHNAHIFYIKVKDLQERQELLGFFKKHNIMAAFHYVPLHSSRAGRKFGEFVGIDYYTTKESERLLRLPLFYDLKKIEQEKIVSLIFDFFKGK
ncbi:MAG: dTDP-4-amino-4,6-dideoxygalactose transaminase [Helicobacteraceae bacterium]|nr:dTDP-4-amino-4,6-dideoxygalactose transaminase [Helicobacteraceae bacterium]